MKIKTFIILLIVLGLLVGAGAFVMHLETPSAPTIAMGSPLVDQLPVNDVVTIAVDGVASPVTLTHKGKGWIVEERFQYPADFSKIIEFVRTLKDAKVGRMFVATDGDLKRLSLKSPDEKGVSDADRAARVRMRDKKGTILLELLVGETRTRGERKLPDGQFVTMGNKPNVYLIDKTLTAYLSGPSSWLAKSPVKVESKAVREMKCLAPDGKTVRFEFKRPANGKAFELVMPKTRKKVKTPSLNRLADALSSLDISDVTDPSKPPEGVKAGVSPVLVYTLFNGTSYRVYPGNSCSATAPCYVRFEVTYAPPKAEKPKETDKKAAKQPGPAVLEKEAKAENKRLSPWVFTIPEWQHKAFMTDVEKLLESPKEKKKD